MSHRKELWGLLGRLLRYPDSETPATAARCHALLPGPHPEVAGLLEEFAAFVGARELGELEEIYTATFDLNPRCHPYAGSHLLGDDPRRGMLLAKLKECYGAHGFEMGSELPDHVAVLLEFLASVEDEETERELGVHLVGPGLQRMAGSFEGSENGYGKLVRAAATVLEEPRAPIASSQAEPLMVSPAVHGRDVADPAVHGRDPAKR